MSRTNNNRNSSKKTTQLLFTTTHNINSKLHTKVFSGRAREGGHFYTLTDSDLPLSSWPLNFNPLCGNFRNCVRMVFKQIWTLNVKKEELPLIWKWSLISRLGLYPRSFHSRKLIKNFWARNKISLQKFVAVFLRREKSCNLADVRSFGIFRPYSSSEKLSLKRKSFSFNENFCIS